MGDISPADCLNSLKYTDSTFPAFPPKAWTSMQSGRSSDLLHFQLPSRPGWYRGSGVERLKNIKSLQLRG